MVSACKSLLALILVSSVLVCTSCLSLTAPRSAQQDTVPPSSEPLRTARRGAIGPKDSLSTPPPEATKPGRDLTESGRTDLEPTDNRLVDTWELMYQVNDKGDEKRPTEASRTLIEFTKAGKVIFNRVDSEDTKRTKSRTGKYYLSNDEIRITDDMGNSVRWPYKITGDTLVIMMPEAKKRFLWRRFK